jgi:hypothetical protein
LGTTDERILKKFIKYKTQRLRNSQQLAPSWILWLKDAPNRIATEV